VRKLPEGWVEKRLEDCVSQCIENWQTKALSDVAKIQSGSGFPLKYQGTVGEQYPFYKVSDMNLSGNEVNMCNVMNTVSEETRTNLKAKVFPPGSIIFPKVGGAIGTNKKRLTTQDCCVDNNVMGLIPKQEIVVSKYLFYFMSSFDLLELSNKANPPSIRQSTVKAWSIPLPPLPEQKRIVAILDEVFAGITKAVTNAEKNLTNARELFSSYLNNVFTQKGEGWVEKALSDVCCITSKLVDPRGPDFKDLPHIGAGNIVSMSTELTGVKSAWEEGLTSGKFYFDDKMVLYSKIRPYLMKVAIPNFDGLCSADIYPLFPYTAELDRGFLYYLLICRNFTDYAISGSQRAGMPKVNRDYLFQYRAFFPDIPKQKQIVAQLNQLSSNTQHLETIYQQKLTALAELKQSILQKAFSGELTAETAPQEVSA